MLHFGWAKIAVHYATEDPYALCYRETFEHAGLHVEAIDELSAREIARFHVLVLCGKSKLDKWKLTSVEEWVRKGGYLVVTGSDWGIHSLLGLSEESSHLSNALISPVYTDRLWPENVQEARFFGGEYKKADVCDVVAKIGEDGVGIGRRRVGKGFVTYIAPHVGQTFKLMQHGRSVECDAIGPTDGSAILDNGILRAEDGTALDFDKDRTTTGDVAAPYFAHAHSDVIRELLIRAILASCDARELAVPLFWHWPRAARGVACLTIDCEEFDRENVNLFHRMLSMFGMPAAWMIGLPGYPVDVYRAMRAWEHEIGLLFQTDDTTGWNEERMKIMVTAITRLSGQPYVESARPQDGRWKNWTKFYELCEVSGARISLCKGGRQPGTSGFLFGTCHPFLPMRKDGSSYFITEIPYSVYFPGVVTPDEVAEDLVREAASRYGCFHMSAPSDGIKNPAFATSLRRVLSFCKQNRMEFMTPEQIQRFERGRRQVRFVQKLLDDEGTLLLSSDVPLEGLTVLLSGNRVSAELKGKEIRVETLERYGTRFNVIQLRVEAKQQVELRFMPEAELEVA